MAEHWKFFVRTVVSCHKDDDLERFMADSMVSGEIKNFEATVRRHWKRIMGPIVKPYVIPELEAPHPPTAKAEAVIESQPVAKRTPAGTHPAMPEATSPDDRGKSQQDSSTVAATAPHQPAPPVSTAATPNMPSGGVSMPPKAPPVDTATVVSSAIPADAVGPATPALLPPPVLKTRPVLKFKLVNGRQSEDFAEVLECTSLDAAYRLIEVAIPPELGLRSDPKTGSIQGKPAASGDFTLIVRYRYQDDIPEAVRESLVDFYVNPNPKLLWKNLPSNRQDPLWKDDEAVQTLAGPLRRIVAARKRGRSHAHVGSCCDDDFVIHHDTANDWYVAIVADGAGSAKASRHGSRLAVRAAGNYIKNALAGDDDLKIAAAVAGCLTASDDGRDHAKRVLHNALYVVVGYAAHKAMKALVDEAQSRPDLISSVKDLSTTLLIGITRKFGDQWLCATYWVGDGAVGVYRQGSSIELLGEVDSGEYSGQTRFLDSNEVTQEALLKRTRFTLCPDFTGFLLMTDGVSDPKFETEARLVELKAWDDLWTDLQSSAVLGGSNPDIKLLEWLDFWSQGNHDDRTIAIIY